MWVTAPDVWFAALGFPTLANMQTLRVGYVDLMGKTFFQGMENMEWKNIVSRLNSVKNSLGRHSPQILLENHLFDICTGFCPLDRRKPSTWILVISKARLLWHLHQGAGPVESILGSRQFANQKRRENRVCCEILRATFFTSLGFPTEKITV